VRTAGRIRLCFFFVCYIEVVSTGGQEMLAGFNRKTKNCAGHNRRFAQTHRSFCSAPTHTRIHTHPYTHTHTHTHTTHTHPYTHTTHTPTHTPHTHTTHTHKHKHTNTHTTHTHTHSVQYPHKTMYPKEHVRYITFTVQSHFSFCLQLIPKYSEKNIDK